MIWLDTFRVPELNIGSAFRVPGMGVADWVESLLPKVALAVASCFFSAKANGYDWKWTARERFKVLLSNETVAFLLGMVWRSFDATISVPNCCQARWLKKLVLGHIKNILSHSLGRAVQENIRFSSSLLALPMVGPILPALNRIFSCTALPLMQ